MAGEGEQGVLVRGGTRPTPSVLGVADVASTSRRAVALPVLSLLHGKMEIQLEWRRQSGGKTTGTGRIEGISANVPRRVQEWFQRRHSSRAKEEGCSSICLSCESLWVSSGHPVIDLHSNYVVGSFVRTLFNGYDSPF
ncbi:hypothetical protein NC653_002030 [Populus alba x Populus x berolinensis]|uniref:Uncharacterized protein n=1 Tax=Populus alba x Populus x berolinensis TaxID=444605 RepID=A0AAD6RMR5_9ROSI|nr:hypothetical protein NC653_002030 [Populus alba x Populus x berolinensis]